MSLLRLLPLLSLCSSTILFFPPPPACNCPCARPVCPLPSPCPSAPICAKRTKRDISNSLMDTVIKVDTKCNSDLLREIIIQNIDRVTAVSKRQIQQAAEKQIGGRFNVICARGDFSYITNTELFCQQTLGDVTCYAFKQLSNLARQ